MLEMGTSGLMSGEGKPPAASRSRSSALPRLYAELPDTVLLLRVTVAYSPIKIPPPESAAWFSDSVLLLMVTIAGSYKSAPPRNSKKESL